MAFDVPFPAIVIAAAALGVLGGYYAPSGFGGAAPAGHAKAASATPRGPATIDDETPAPAHARFSRARLVGVVAAGIVLWAAAYLALRASVGSSPVFTDMAGFFTKAALLTFGGAYAVLPYVYQGAVEHFGWLTGPQMIDGLALGETTPGPLIMVLQFVGFVAAWQNPGDLSPLAAGALGAAITTWVTFLPCFLFVFLGAPHVEGLRERPALASTLTAITAAVVGVILNLALWFALHALWPEGRSGKFDAFVAVGAVAVWLAMERFKVGVIPTLGICALLAPPG
jgi:chromate transporter